MNSISVVDQSLINKEAIIGENVGKAKEYGYKVLIVNDEPFLLMSMKLLVEQLQDTEIVQAMNGDEAVKINLYTIDGLLIVSESVQAVSGINEWRCNYSLAAGMYVYELQSENGTKTKQMIKF